MAKWRSRSPVRFHRKAVLIRLSYTIWRIIRAGARAGCQLLPDAQTLEKGAVTGKCQLAALPSAGVTRETDDNGFVVSATGKEMKVEYRYDSEGYPLGKTTINSQNTLSVTAKPSAHPRKSWITRQSAGWMIDRSATSHRAANMMRTRTLLTAGLLSSMRALSRQCPTITPLKSYRLLLNRARCDSP